MFNNSVNRKLRKNTDKIGLITGVSGLMTKQSYALWSDNYIDNFSMVDVSNNKKIEKPIPLSNKILEQQ